LTREDREEVRFETSYIAIHYRNTSDLRMQWERVWLAIYSTPVIGSKEEIGCGTFGAVYLTTLIGCLSNDDGDAVDDA